MPGKSRSTTIITLWHMSLSYWPILHWSNFEIFWPLCFEQNFTLMKAFVSFKCVPLYIVKNQYKHPQVIDYPLSVSAVLWCFSRACCVKDFFDFFFTPGILSSLVISRSRSQNSQHKAEAIWPFPKPGGLEMAPRHTSLWHCFHSTTCRCSWWIKPAPQKQVYITLQFTPDMN